MDSAGWSSVADVLAFTGLSRDQLEDVVAGNNKQRYQLEEARIRACQGHSLAGTPVTLEGLEASWTLWAGTTPLWHGTHPDACSDIVQQGILAMNRSHVHLASAPDSPVGKRAAVTVLLGVDPERLRASGQRIFVAPNGVMLVRQVPPAALVALLPRSRRAQRQLASLLALPWPSMAPGGGAP